MKDEANFRCGRRLMNLFLSFILHPSSLSCWSLISVGVVSLHAQTPTPPPLVPNGDFESLTVAANLWDGVDNNNNMRTLTYANYITVEGGNAAHVNFPSSPQMTDMDGDGLKDLVVGDPSGFIWIFKNRGEKGKPKFTTGQFVPAYYGGAAKLWVGDFSGDNRQDIVVGTAFGHVIYVKNIGSPQKWKFTTDMGRPRYCWPGYVQQGYEIPYVQLGKGDLLFGTYMAPAIADWDNPKDGRKDLILGDGTYSANSIWLLRNTGSNLSPRFDPDEKHYLAYGEGREQLVPTICDLNGDDLPDLIVSDRQGYINLHLNKKDLPKDTPKPVFGQLPSAKADKAPPVIPYSGRIKCGGQEQFPGPLAVAACDWNDDGLFDLLLGYPDGTCAVALNSGSKTEWKFEGAQQIKGTDTEKDFQSPSGWSYSYTGVANSCFTVRALAEDKMPNGEVVRPKSGKYMCKFAYEHDYPGWVTHSNWNYIPGLSRHGWTVGGRSIHIGTGALTVGKKYEVSMWVRGGDVKPVWIMWNHVNVRTSRKGRAGTRYYEVEAPFTAVEGNWTKFTKTFICPGPDKNERIKADNDKVSFQFALVFPGKGYCYLDDVQLEEVKALGAMPVPNAPPAPQPPK